MPRYNLKHVPSYGDKTVAMPLACVGCQKTKKNNWTVGHPDLIPFHVFDTVTKRTFNYLVLRILHCIRLGTS